MSTERKPVLYRSPQITITHRHVTVDGIRIPIGRLLPMERCLTYRRPFQRTPRRMEIHATIDGQWTVLYSTTDHREFGRVWRALIRAVEHHRDDG
ncbi:DUF6232 family protein [Actinoplanes sp. G11-F43]|uniref:DUF6232 family protein n=1 Tax=Actinoplanes sp. G11-F43 TaxID=3424130 RepID=UPI003D350D50